MNGAYATVARKGLLRYAFDAFVMHVVDGDTLVLEVVLGESARGRFRFRLRGVNAVEAGTPLGDEATAYVRRRLPVGTPALIHSYGHDMYGRYVVDVFYGTDVAPEHPADGTYLNRELVEAGMVRLLK